MKISTVFIFASICAIIIFPSCKKETLSKKELTIPVLPVVPDDKVPPTTDPITYDRIINVGTGSGVLVIDGKTLATQCNDLIKIKGGVYTSITIKNILSADGCPITIKNDGLVEFVGNFNGMGLSNLKNVVISGNGTAGLEKGFLFRDNVYRSIEITGTLNKFTLQYVAFKNIGDLDIAFKDNTIYNGSETSYSQDLKFLHMSCDNTSQFLTTGGYIENGVIYGLVKNIEIANLDFQNSPGVGSVVYLGNVEDFNIHNNKINNINTQNNNHNGIFQVAGNGRFHNNFVSNHQGNAIRAWGHSIGTVPKEILIYNNIIINSRKYSGFEVQAHADRMIPGKTTYTNAFIFNNTCGNINISKDWEGGVVDVYSLQGGKCDVYNNIGYAFQNPKKIALQWAELIPNSFNNLYFDTYTQAGIVDEISFKLNANSPAKNTGKLIPTTVKDYYGSSRSSTPSIGAVE